MTRTPLRLDRVTVEWTPDPEWPGTYGCVARAQVSYAYAIKDGDRRLEWLTSGGFWGIDGQSSPSYCAEVERIELADLRDHLTKFGLRVSDAEWRRWTKRRAGAESTCTQSTSTAGTSEQEE